MKRARRIAAALVVFGCIVGATRIASAGTYDPFRPGGKADGGERALDPFRRVAQALPVPPAQEPAKAQPAPAAKAAPAPAAAPQPAPKACQKDEDCPERNICQANVCQKIELSTNLFPLYYHEGRFTEVFLVYWSRSGNPGYTVVAPFYWHFYSPTSESFAIAPIYWHFTDSTRQSELTVLIPFSWSHEPGASSFAIWPLFYASNKFGWAIPILLTFNVGDSKIGNQYGAFLGLYWWKRSQKGAFDFGLLPPYVSSRNAAHAFTWVAPLNFYWRNSDDKNLLALPLFYKNTHNTGNAVYTWLGYSRREGREYSGTAFWLYWYGRDEQSHERYDVLFPLLWSFRGDTSKTTVFFPLVWSFSTPKTNTTIVGPFIHRRNDTSWVDALFPLWWSGGDDATGRGFKAFIPLFIWKSDTKAKTATLMTLAGGYTKDDAAGTRTGLIWPLLTYWSREPNSETNVVTPLYISHYSKTEHSMTRFALLFYQREDPRGSTTTFFPLFGYFHDTATDASALVTPLGGFRSGPRDTTVLFLNFYWRAYKPDGSGGWNAGLFPLFFFGRNKGTAHAIAFPLFWHLSDTDSSTTALVPLFYWHRDRKGYALATPLLFMGRSGGESYTVQFPLFWHFASERRGTSTTYTPVGYYHKDQDGWSTGVGPLVPLLFIRSGKTKSHFALVPLFWHFADRSEDKTTTVVLNYMHRTQGSETTDAFYPLLYYRRGAKPGGADETSFTFFPLVHYRRDANTRVLATPLFASAKGPNRSGGFVGPYIWYDDKDLSFRFIPFLHADITRRDTGERTRQYGIWFQVDAPDRNARVLFPFWGTYTNPQETGTWVVPTFFRLRRNNGDRVDAFLPLYWRSSFGERKTTVVGPYYDRAAPGVHNYGVVPLFFKWQNAARTITTVPLLLSYIREDNNGESAWRWSILYFHKHDRESAMTTFFPLYWSFKHGGHETAVGFPFYWHVADAQENRSWTYAFPLFWSSSGSWRTRGFLTAWYSRDTAGEYKSHAFLPLFYEASAPDHFALLTPLAGYRRSGASRMWYALCGLMVSTDSVQTRFNMFAPLFFRHTDKALERTTTVVPPGLFVSRTTPEESFTTAAALFWRYEDIASSTNIVLPLFYDVNDYHLSRTTVFFPLFLRHHNHAEQSTTWISPFFYSHTTPTYATTFGAPLVVLPLYWNIKRGNDETTLVFPLYAHWKRQGYRSTLVVPFYYHTEGLREDGTTDGTYRRFVGAVVPFYDSGVKRLGDFNWNLLGGLVGGERIGHHNFFRLFWFFNFETGAAPRAQTAWYSAPQRTSRKVAARGLDVAGF